MKLYQQGEVESSIVGVSGGGEQARREEEVLAADLLKVVFMKSLKKYWKKMRDEAHSTRKIHRGDKWKTTKSPFSQNSKTGSIILLL